MSLLRGVLETEHLHEVLDSVSSSEKMIHPQQSPRDARLARLEAREALILNAQQQRVRRPQLRARLEEASYPVIA